MLMTLVVRDPSRRLDNGGSHFPVAAGRPRPSGQEPAVAALRFGKV